MDDVATQLFIFLLAISVIILTVGTPPGSSSPTRPVDIVDIDWKMSDVLEHTGRSC